MNIIITRKRMKSIRMTVEPTDGSVKVSAPKRVSVKQIQDFVASKKAWIEKAQEYYATSRELLTVPEGELLLHGVGYTIQTGESIKHNGKKKWVIDHERKILSTTIDLTIPANQIVFYKAYAKEYLVLELQKTAEKHGLTFAKCIIRGQKTKRGTCSSTKNIWLNRKLVKMPHEIAQYVICHELAHLKHLNHSSAFWEEVARLYPDYKAAAAWMKKYGLSLQ
jgi:predicted metal-dependent hydrolase